MNLANFQFELKPLYILHRIEFVNLQHEINAFQTLVFPNSTEMTSGWRIEFLGNIELLNSGFMQSW